MAPGGIPLELFEYAIGSISSTLHSMFIEVWLQCYYHGLSVWRPPGRRHMCRTWEVALRLHLRPQTHWTNREFYLPWEYLKSSSGHYKEDLKQCISLASSAMFSLNNTWKDQHISLGLKTRLCRVLAISACFTLLFEDLHKIEGFHTKCLRFIMGIWWYDFVINHEILSRAPMPPLLFTLMVALGIDESISSAGTTTTHDLPRCGVMPSSNVIDQRQCNGPLLAMWKWEWMKGQLKAYMQFWQ